MFPLVSRVAIYTTDATGCRRAEPAVRSDPDVSLCVCEKPANGVLATDTPASPAPMIAVVAPTAPPLTPSPKGALEELLDKNTATPDTGTDMHPYTVAVYRCTHTWTQTCTCTCTHMALCGVHAAHASGPTPMPTATLSMAPCVTATLVYVIALCMRAKLTSVAHRRWPNVGR